MNNRIENFLKRKRDDCNDRNTRLYCKNVYLNSSRTCDTIAPKRQKGSECFIKSNFLTHKFKFIISAILVCIIIWKHLWFLIILIYTETSANNISGPLCNGGFDPASENSYKLKISNNFYGDKSDIYERLSNVETCLNMEVDDHNINIYEKIKSIEDRLLQLENERSNDKKVLSSNIQHTEMINYNDNHCIQVNLLLFNINKNIFCNKSFILFLLYFQNTCVII